MVPVLVRYIIMVVLASRGRGLMKYISCFRLVVNITEVFRYEYFSEENVTTTVTVFEKDVALLRLTDAMDIDTYQTVSLPEVNADYTEKQATYYGESAIGY